MKRLWQFVGLCLLALAVVLAGRRMLLPVNGTDSPTAPEAPVVSSGTATPMPSPAIVGTPAPAAGQPPPAAAAAFSPTGSGASGAGALTASAEPDPAIDVLQDPAARAAWIEGLKARADRDARAGASAAAKAGMPARGSADGTTYEFAAVRDGRVYVRTTRNREAAISTATDRVRETPPYGLSGTGLIVAVWDAGSVYSSHQEFVGRLTLRDNVPSHSHSTHVGGTIAAAGVDGRAKGMAPAVRLHSFDWSADTAEMAAAGRASPTQVAKVELSSHSYGFQAGWFGSTWYGTWGEAESDGFGLYDSFAAELDEVAYNTPYLLSFKAVGNDRNDPAPSAGTIITYFDETGSHTKAYDPATDPPGDFVHDGGYDTIAYESNAKNIVAVGAVNDAAFAGARSLGHATMSAFSSWGPTDDGRVKPDIMANGASLYSSLNYGAASYGNLSGTSMACPNAMGSAALLVEHYGRLFPGRYMRASTLKALILHTADDLGAPGPDFQFGWGLMNTLAAVQHLDAHVAWTNAARVVEAALTAAAPTNRIPFYWDGTHPIKVTLCWTDPPAAPRSSLDDRTPVLVNDLDLRVVAPGGAVGMPYMLNATNPTLPAATGDNAVDNVEQVVLASPTEPGLYTAVIGADDILSGASQPYALLVSGSTASPAIEHVPLVNTTNNAGPYTVEARIQSENALEPARLLLWWRVGGASPFVSNVLVHAGGDLYTADIPGQPGGSRVEYYLEAGATNGLVRTDPDAGPAAPHHFEIVTSVSLLVSGQPGKVPGVDPPYGYTSFPSGVLVHATAPLYSPPLNGARDVCIGWRGCCSVPWEGTTNMVDFVIEQDAFLVWQWSKAYSLTQLASLPDTIAAETWWRHGFTGETVSAAATLTRDGTNYAFTSWFVDGARMPNATDAAANPAGVVMTAPRTAVAEYLPADRDGDGDGVADWWELFYFGATNAPLNLDSDDDGFTNRKEYDDHTNPRDPDSVPTPPSIAHVPLANPQTLPAPWAVSAVVTDNDAVERVTLDWQRNAGGWQSVTMQPAGPPGAYDGTVPTPGVTGDQFAYRIVARDRAGLQAVNGVYAFAVAYPAIQTDPTDLGTVLLPADGNGRVLLRIQNVGHQPLDWQLRALPAGLRDDVEAGGGGWTHGGQNDVWHISTRRAYSGSNAWYFGREDTGQYPDSAKAWLISPPVLLPEGATFSFRQWLFTEELQDPTHAWDGAIVELSMDGGETYVQITPQGGYPYTIFGHSASAFANETPCFAGTGGWQRVTFDLDAYAGQLVRLRLHFGSDGYVVNEGWYVDDLAVEPFGGVGNWLATSGTNELTAAQGAATVQITLDAHPLDVGETRRAVLYIASNDPLSPEIMVPIALHNTTRRIDISREGQGTVTPPGPVMLQNGDDIDFVIAAAPYYHIGSIATNGGIVEMLPDATFTHFLWDDVSLASSGTLHTVFAPNKTTNGVTETWLVSFGLTNAPFNVEALTDHDGDRMASWEEFIAGTDPTNAKSRFQIECIASWGTQFVEDVHSWTTRSGVVMCYTQFFPIADGHILSWGGVSNRLYTVYGAPGVTGAYAVLGDAILATPPMNVHTDMSDTVNTRYYRLGVRLAD